MKISQIFLKRFALLSGIFLLLGSGLLFYTFSSIVLTRAKDSIQTEIQSAAAIATQTYGFGDLFSLRSNLDSMAKGKWYKATFLNQDKEIIWEFGQHSESIALPKLAQLIWPVINLFSAISLDTPFVLKESIGISIGNNPDSGKLIISKLIYTSWQKDMAFVVRSILIFFLFWGIYLAIIWSVANRTLFPITLLEDELKAEGQKIAIELNKEKGSNELQNIRTWFDQLLGAWKEEQQKAIANERNVAMGQVTSILAHDVRKPFSMLKIILSSFDLYQKNPSRLQESIKSIDKSIKHVESMIDDLMDVAREVKLDTKPSSLWSLLDFSIRQACLGKTNHNISFTYQLKAGKKPLLDDVRIMRVFVNIIANGIEAITEIGQKSSGTMQFSSTLISHNKKEYVEIVVANDGPLFKEGTEEKLFDFSFTHGKNKGTGLGLASAKKIISLHDGSIVARNKADGNGVEFIIRIPASTSSDPLDEAVFPQNCQECSLSEEERTHVESGIETIEKANHGIKILLLEDEVLYRAWVKNLINDNPTLKKMITLYDASTVEEALQLVGSEKPEFAIVDIDLGEEKTGLDFLKELKKSHPHIKSMIHSNRTLQDIKDEARSLGAQKFVGKPLSLSSLIELLNIDDGKTTKLLESSDIKKVYFCDDEPFAREYFKNIVDDLIKNYQYPIKLYSFENGEKLLEKTKEAIPDLVFTDLRMKETGGKLTGYELMGTLKSISPDILVYLLSNEPLTISADKTKEAGGDGAFEGLISSKQVNTIFEKLLQRC